ncbi:MAG: hypothetical protein IAF38_08945 [Bacteroidia bacterium]|nr:hypothetical protein [Bacteroidia bacterium]
MWWRGSNGSLGLLRVIACVAPLGALLALTGISGLLKLIKNKTLAISAVLLFAILCFVILFLRSGFPPEINKEDKLTQEAGTWLKKNNYLGRKIIFSNPYLPFYLGLDPIEKERTQELNNVEKFAKGDIIVWDSHFGPNEDGFPESKFRNDSAFVILDNLRPTENFVTLGNKIYEIYILERK